MRFESLMACALLVGCAADPGSRWTKDEAAGLAGGADFGRDLCQDEAWYGDGECDAFCPSPDPDCGVLRNLDGEGPTLCVGVRGNGPRMTAHWSSLARILEEHGLVDGVAGGSSGSITSFFLDSVEANPLVTCEGCSREEQGARAAVLLKSMQAYVRELALSDEVLAARALLEIQDELRAEGIEALLASDDPTAGVDALVTLLQSEKLRGLVNPEVLTLLRSSPDPVFHARDITSTLAAAANFEIQDETIFVRPTILSFPALAEHIGAIATFYAGWEPVDIASMEIFLRSCGSPGRGLLWADTAELEADGMTCGQRFEQLVRDYRAATRTGAYPSRLDDHVGSGIHALVSTSVLQGEAVATFHRARASYEAAEAIDWSIHFDDVRFGYWGAPSDLARIMSNPSGFQDAKTGNATSLGSATWREVLAYSPAEPGLARALELPDGRVSAGGWSDLHPTLVLRNMGCEQVIYLTRRGSDNPFEMEVARLLGATDTENDAYFRWSAPGSSFAVSVAEADGVWCTDWDAPAVSDLAAMERIGYEAPFEVRDPQLDTGYRNATRHVGLSGCSVGVDD